jgi:hypothetical protein
LLQAEELGGGAAKQIFDILFGQTLSGLEHLVLGKVPSGCG